MTRVGVLALQGGFSLHITAVCHLGYSPCEIRKPNQLADLDVLIIPGGETSALLELMQPWGFLAAIRQFADRGGRIIGTCAGSILLASQVQPEQDSLKLIDMTIARNAYGRQQESFVAKSDPSKSFSDPVSLAFIRAPKIIAVGDAVKVLLTHNDDPVLLQQDQHFAATFHPELSAPEVLQYCLSV